MCSQHNEHSPEFISLLKVVLEILCGVFFHFSEGGSGLCLSSLQQDIQEKLLTCHNCALGEKKWVGTLLFLSGLVVLQTHTLNKTKQKIEPFASWLLEQYWKEWSEVRLNKEQVELERLWSFVQLKIISFPCKKIMFVSGIVGRTNVSLRHVLWMMEDLSFFWPVIFYCYLFLWFSKWVSGPPSGIKTSFKGDHKKLSAIILESSIGYHHLGKYGHHHLSWEYISLNTVWFTSK